MIGPATVLATEWTLIFVVTVVISARLYLRVKIQHRKLLVSDILMCAAWVTGIIAASFTIKYLWMGALEPHVQISLKNYEGGPEDIILILKLIWFSNIPFHTTFYLCKAALLAVYLQLFPAFMVKRRHFLWATITYVAVAYIATMLVLLCICLPLSGNWDLNPETCPTSSVALVFQVAWALHFFGDLLIFVLPWLIITELNMDRTLKIGVYFTFLLGLINIAVCMVRFIEVQNAGADMAISLATVMFWSSLDLYVGLVIACLPSLRPYLRSRGTSYRPSSSYNNKKSKSTRSGKCSEVGLTGVILTKDQELGSIHEPTSHHVQHSPSLTARDFDNEPCLELAELQSGERSNRLEGSWSALGRISP